MAMANEHAVAQRIGSAIIATLGIVIALLPLRNAANADLRVTLAQSAWLIAPYAAVLAVSSMRRLGGLYPTRALIMSVLVLAVSLLMMWPPTHPLLYVWTPVYQWVVILVGTAFLVKRRRYDEAI